MSTPDRIRPIVARSLVVRSLRTPQRVARTYFPAFLLRSFGKTSAIR